MSLYQTAVRKPITTILIFIGIAILGIFSLLRLPIDLYPNIETNQIMVITAYNGASAADVETNVSKTLENMLNSVSNLKHITSNSRDNISVINLEFNEGTDIAEATNDVRDKLDAVSGQLPDDANKPIIFKFGTEDIPIAILSVQASNSTKALKKILENKVTNVLARVDGVGAVSVAGTVKREIQIYCDPMKIEAYGISVAQIGQMIIAENRNVPSGQIEIGSDTKSIRVQGEYGDPKEMLDLVVGSFAGRNIYLRDVARIEDSAQERQQEIYNNGVRGAIIVINKQSGANSVAISKAVKAELPAIQASLPKDVKINVIVDTADYITNTISRLSDTIFITFFVVMLVVLFFLGRWRATFIIVLTIPISLVGAFIYLMFTDNSLNIISLSSLSIAIGMVVDDAIVVLENVTTHIERGSYPKQAAVHGTNEVAISVVASTLTMLAVFLPLTMVTGLTGILFRQLGWIVSIIMIVSTIAALTLTPTLSAQMLKRKTTDGRIHRKLFGPIERLLNNVDRLYERSLHTAVRHRTIVIVGAIIIFVGSISLIPLLKMQFLPQADTSYIRAEVEYPIGTRMEISRDLGQELSSRWLKEMPEVRSCNFSVGQADADNAFASMGNNGSNILTFNISLVNPSQRKRTMQDVAEQMRTSLFDYPGIRSYRVIAGAQSGGTGGEEMVALEIYGHDFNATGKLAKQLMADMKKLSSCSEVNISRKDYASEIQVDFDRIKLAENGLNIAMASSFLRNSINGMIAGYYREDGDEYTIRVHLEPSARQSIEAMGNLLIYSPQGKAIQLRELGKIVERYSPPSIERKDRQRIVTLTGVVAKGKALSDLVGEIRRLMKQTEMPDGISYKIGGTYEEQQKSNQALFTLLILIIILVFIVMAAEFESLLDPFVIMFSIPFAITGVILGLLLTGTVVSVMVLIGLIILMGVVVKNGIVLIDYTRLCRERGMSILEAVVAAGRSRLRPVLMTTATTVLGMLPMAIGIGEGSETWQPMGIAVVWGLSVSTLITLILVPTIYATVSARELKRQRRRETRKRKQGKH